MGFSGTTRPHVLADLDYWRFEPVDEIDDVVEPAPDAGADAASGAGDGKLGLAGAGSADQHDVRCWAMKPPPERSFTSVSLISVPSNWKSSRSFASGSLAMAS
jgi:hypothetical protein